ncbi:hypothetical protein N781_15945 [Pontibacillus halophilus JSM 076056 = DSM 19796]|uniref:DUF3221 domain-containing protein n=1 Tax=Pontibacillus halophilus JSM 076056 = DSM 19796 TaxID=1385510 RepID=A0A0A5GF47_9BACI|nr:hypothetical protein [Pontibacillus halophilus]KGX89745.1 hypothetical protein N781_15945 [Pontibacillus halophilus JSM 076056 = DSM 19796]
MLYRKTSFIIATLALALVGCNQPEEGTYIEGNITEINEVSGDMEIDIESWSTVGDEESSSTKFGFTEKPSSETIRVHHPEDYDEGQAVRVNVIKNYEEEVWDLNRLKFDIKEVS